MSAWARVVEQVVISKNKKQNALIDARREATVVGSLREVASLGLAMSLPAAHKRVYRP